MVNLIAHMSDPVDLSSRIQTAEMIHLEPTVSEDTVVLVESMIDLLEKHGLCLAKGLTPLMPEAEED